MGIKSLSHFLEDSNYGLMSIHFLSVGEDVEGRKYKINNYYTRKICSEDQAVKIRRQNFKEILNL